MSQDDKEKQIVAKRKRKTEMAGAGCLIQAVGLVALVFFPIGTFIGVILLVYGSMKSTYFICSHCGNRLSDKNVKICPTCHAQLS